MKIKKGHFTGGYRFRRYQGQPSDEIIESGIPDLVVIPLKQGFGNELPPLVRPGERVRAGQIIARDDSTVSSPVHASVNGVVQEISSINYFKEEIRAVRIKSDGSSEWRPLDGHSRRWKDLTVEKLRELIYLSGVSSLDREGIPTDFKSSVIPPDEVRHVIVHGIGSEPYNLSVSLLLKGKRLLQFVESLRILKKIMPAADLHVALNRHHKNLLEELSRLLADEERTEICALEPKYPQGYDEILVPVILGKPFPYGYSAANIGVVIINIQAALQLYEAVAEGKPLIERTVALCGPGFRENLHLKVRVGSSVRDAAGDYKIEGNDTRFILNSPLTGFPLSDLSLPVNRTFTNIIALPERRDREFLFFIRPGPRKDSYSNTFLSKFVTVDKESDTNAKGERRPCIFCNFCQEVCPVDIIPHIFYHHVERRFIDEHLLSLRIFNCIQCKLCSFVCPSKIPLAESIKEGMETLINMGCDRSLCILPYFDLKGIEEYRGLK